MNFCIACTYKKSNIKENLRKEEQKPIRRLPVLTEMEERMIKILAEWGFPVDGQDIRYFVKSYLDKKGVKIQLSDNLPTYQWLKSFLACHKDFSFRTPTHIKRAHAQVSRKE